MKEFSIVVRDQSIISRSTQASAKTVEFPAKCLRTSTDGNGTVTAVLQLGFAYGGHGDAATVLDASGATQRLLPTTATGGSTVTVTSKLFAGIPLESISSLFATVEAKGPNRGSIVGLYFIAKKENLVTCKKTPTGKFPTLFNYGGVTFSITLDGLRGFTDREGNFSGNDPNAWDGKSGTWIFVDASGLWAEGIPAGPDSGDYSFLETKTERGEFD